MTGTKHVQCIAHKGGGHLAPENTLAAFRNALSLQVDMIELDVHLTRDGQLIVFHDNTLEQHTDGTGNILDLDFAYLRSLNAAAHFPGGWPTREQIPTLHEVLELTKGRAKLFIELKMSKRNGQHGRYPHLAEAVVKEVQSAGMQNQVVLISFGWDMLAQVKTLDPTIQTALVLGKEQAHYSIEELLAHAKELKSEWIDIEHVLLTPEMAPAIHNSNLKLAIWTANTLEDLQRCKDMGADALTTDRPDLCAQL